MSFCKMKNIILLLRPHQWLKNFFIFLPLFFDKHLGDVNYILTTVICFFSFCFMASSIYCFNDIWDVEADKAHPKKRMRPVASGKVSKKGAYCLMLACAVVSLLLLTVIDTHFYYLLTVLAIYYILNLAYCIKLKQVALVDVFIIAIGFVLRVLAGGFATGIWTSHWIVLMTFLLALFLAFAKRRDDVVIYEETGVKVRKSVNRYNLEFMNQAITILASITMVCYIMYTVSGEVIERMGTSYLYVTSIFVLAGIIRYLQLTIVDIKSGSPTKVLMKDRFIQLSIVCWVLAFGILIYCK